MNDAAGAATYHNIGGRPQLLDAVQAVACRMARASLHGLTMQGALLLALQADVLRLAPAQCLSAPSQLSLTHAHTHTRTCTLFSLMACFSSFPTALSFSSRSSRSFNRRATEALLRSSSAAICCWSARPCRLPELAGAFRPMPPVCPAVLVSELLLLLLGPLLNCWRSARTADGEVGSEDDSRAASLAATAAASSCSRCVGQQQVHGKVQRQQQQCRLSAVTACWLPVLWRGVFCTRPCQPKAGPVVNNTMTASKLA